MKILNGMNQISSIETRALFCSGFLKDFVPCSLERIEGREHEFETTRIGLQFESTDCHDSDRTGVVFFSRKECLEWAEREWCGGLGLYYRLKLSSPSDICSLIRFMSRVVWTWDISQTTKLDCRVLLVLCKLHGGKLAYENCFAHTRAEKAWNNAWRIHSIGKLDG